MVVLSGSPRGSNSPGMAGVSARRRSCPADRPIPRRVRLLLLAPFVASLLIGCAGPRKSAQDLDAAQLSDEGFQAYLAEVDLVTVDEAYRAILILADGEDLATSFDERRQDLESRGIARSAWNLKPVNVIDTGSVAYMVCRVCEIAGGVNAHLFGRLGLGDRRYALRELLYREMIEDTVDYQYMTGAAFITVLAKADALMEEKGLYETEVIDLSDETDRDELGDLVVPPSDHVPAEDGTGTENGGG